MSFNLCENDLRDEQLLSEKLMDLASIVFTRHFYANYDEREDLISVGVLKALSLLEEGNFVSSKGKLLSFLYTGMRNEMHNYIYRISREVICEDSFIDNNYCSPEEYESSFLDIDYKAVKKVCLNFISYGDLGDIVSYTLMDMGFKVLNFNSSTENKQVLDGWFSEDFYRDLINRICGVVIWERQEYSR